MTGALGALAPPQLAYAPPGQKKERGVCGAFCPLTSKSPYKEHPEQPLTRAEAWTPCACSLQHRELMVQGNKFEQQVTALAEPRPRCRKLSKNPSRHELWDIR